MHHLILLNDHVDGGKRVVDLFSSGHVVSHGHDLFLDTNPKPVFNPRTLIPCKGKNAKAETSSAR